MSFLGIDVGTTRIKAVVYEPRERRVVGERHAPTPVHSRAAGEVHDPDELFGVALALAADVVAAAEGATPLEGLSVASMGEEVVLVDDRAAAVGDVLAWYNPLGRELAPAFLDRFGADLFPGVRPDPTFSLFKLLWIAEHRPRDLAGAVRVTDVADYLLWRLGGGPPETIVMDWSHASRTGLLDLGAHVWNTAAVDAAGLDVSLLPRLVSSGTPIGQLSAELAERLGADGPIALVSGGHDHFCAAYAVGVRRPGSVFISAGTSEAVLLLTAHLPQVPPGEHLDAGCFVDEELWYLHQAIPSGHVFRQWRALLYADTADEELYGEVGALAGAETHARCVVDPAGPAATFADVDLHATRGHLMRALLEALACDARTALERLERLGGREGGEVIVAGQPARRCEWLDLRARVLDRPLVVAQHGETSALGAALLAQRGVTGVADPDVVTSSVWARPDASVERPCP